MVEETLAAYLAGWDVSKGPAPFKHSLPPPIDPELGHNGIRPTRAKIMRLVPIGDPWPAVWAEHQRNIGFREGPRNANPWTKELGIGYASYCAAAATLVPHHQGVQWFPECEFGARGDAYSPDFERWGSHRGIWQYDHASKGQPCDLLTGDLITYDWNGDGVADHTETLINSYSDLTFDTIGYNTGSPEGCHFPIRRNRKYLIGRLRCAGVFYGDTTTPINPGPSGVPMDFNPPFNIVGRIVSDWFPPGGGHYQFTDAGFVYAWGGARYSEINGGGPAADPNTHWNDGHRVGAKIGPPMDPQGNPIPGMLYTCVDTAGERYTY